MEVGLVVEARLVRHLSQRGGVVEIEQAHDPVHLQDLPEELRVDPDDMIEAPIELARVGGEPFANFCHADGAVGSLELCNRTLDEGVAGPGALRECAEKGVRLRYVLIPSALGTASEMLAREGFEIWCDI